METLLRQKIERANILVEALPYIQKYAGETFVIKYGGNAMVDESLKNKVVQDIVLLKQVGINIVLVHGGGPHLTDWLGKINKKSEFIEGLRVTDNETVEVAEMVFVGKVNKNIVSLIHKNGGNAIGLSGRDGRLITAVKKETRHDLGFVGEVQKINTKLIENISKDGYILVISSIGECQDGQAYNINADVVAGAIATSLNAKKLFLLTDVDGVMKNGELIPRLTIPQIDQLIKEGVVSGGMIPKLQGAVDCINGGTDKVHIINGQIEHSLLLEIFTDHGIGTMIRK